MLRRILAVGCGLTLLILPAVAIADVPATSNYQLNSYGFGSGGVSSASTSNYALEGTTGDLAGPASATSNYTTKPGFIETQTAHVPTIASFDNGGGTYYNKLHFVIDQQGNPSDATYALQISTTSDFSSAIFYVKSDHTIGATLTTGDYLDYATWGGGSGSNIIGLTPNTTYYLRAKATQGQFTESGYGPSATAATVNPSLSFSVSPSSLNFGNIGIGNPVTNSPSNISVSFATNATNGGNVYINGVNTTAGLYSSSANATIPSTTTDLSTASHGFGAKITANSASAGTFSKVSPYDGASDNVGLIDTIRRRIFTSSGLVTGGSGTIQLKAKADITDPARTDYSETVTLIAAASF